MVSPRGSVPERPKGADCKSAGTAYEGSNPSRPTLQSSPRALHLPGRRLSLQWRYEYDRRVSSRSGGRGGASGSGSPRGRGRNRGEDRHDGSHGKDCRSGTRLRSFGRPGRRAGPRPLDDLGRGRAAALALQRARRSRPRARCRPGRRIAPARTAGGPRVHRRHRHHLGVDPPGLAVRVEAPRRVVLRCPRRRHGGVETVPLLRVGRHLRGPRPVHAGLVRLDPDPLAGEGGAGQEARVGAGVVDRAAAPGAPAVQPRHLQLRGAGRDDEPPHQPVPLRPRRAGRRPLGDVGRPPVDQHPRALRAAVHGDRRAPHQRRRCTTSWST